MTKSLKIRERKKHIDAFNYWYNAGRIRNVSKVAVKFHVSERTLWNWHRKFNWPQRAVDRTETIKRKVEERSTTEIAERRAKLIKVAEATIAQYVENLKRKRIKITSAADLDKLSRLVMYLSGEPDIHLSVKAPEKLIFEIVEAKNGKDKDRKNKE